MRIAVITSLFPNSREKNRGIFTQKLLECMGDHKIIVVAPIPWFPFVKKNRVRGVPFKEKSKGITVYHPRFFSVPFFFKFLDSFFFFISIYFLKNKIEDCQVIYSSYGYPDGVGSYWLSKIIRKPFCITLHRGDVVYWLNRRFIGKQFVRMMKGADGIFLVAEQLKKLLDSYRLENLFIVPNGVDRDIFHSMDQTTARRKLGLSGSAKIFLTVGSSFRRKGYFELAEAFSRLEEPESLLLIIGYDQKDYDSLSFFCGDLTEGGSIKLLGEVDNEKLPLFYAAADVYCLVSHSEGWPCSVMEALACGKPCVVTQEAAGEFITDGLGIVSDHENLTDNLKKSLFFPWDQDKIVGFAEANSWNSVAEKMIDHFDSFTSEKIAKIEK